MKINLKTKKSLKNNIPISQFRIFANLKEWINEYFQTSNMFSYMISRKINSEFSHLFFTQAKINIMVFWQKLLYIKLSRILESSSKFLDLKFIYSEKATKFCELFTLLTFVLCSANQKQVEEFVAFSEYMNFEELDGAWGILETHFFGK